MGGVTVRDVEVSRVVASVLCVRSGLGSGGFGPLDEWEGRSSETSGYGI